MNRKRWTAIGTLAGLLAAAPSAVYASENGRTNTAMALGVAAIHWSIGLFVTGIGRWINQRPSA